MEDQLGIKQMETSPAGNDHPFRYLQLFMNYGHLMFSGRIDKRSKVES